MLCYQLFMCHINQCHNLEKREYKNKEEAYDSLCYQLFMHHIDQCHNLEECKYKNKEDKDSLTIAKYCK